MKVNTKSKISQKYFTKFDSSYFFILFLVLSIDQTTHDNGHEVYCSNTTDTWNNGILLYSGPRLNTDITIFAICIYVIYVPPVLSGGSTVELCEIEIGGKYQLSSHAIYVFLNSYFLLWYINPYINCERFQITRLLSSLFVHYKKHL